MTSSAYLDMLDELLGPGIARLSGEFRATQSRFVVGCQLPDGGFRGRQGASDLYYTDFALRTLAWLAPEDVAFGLAARYLAGCRSDPRSIIECFGLLSSVRVLSRQSVASTTLLMPDLSCIADCLREHAAAAGGFSRSSGDLRTSAYHTFLGALCFQLLGLDAPEAGKAIDAIGGLARPDGGFAELSEQRHSQTNATAAAVAFLLMHDALSTDRQREVVGFLTAMRADDGGCRAHWQASAGDLLSTFTGVLTLAGLGAVEEIDGRGTARFLRKVAGADGGFLACPTDDRPDVEYTYYGVATLALLQLVASQGP